MFSRLGQLLALYYLKDEHEEIQRRVADEGIDPTSASRVVLGLSFDQLGVEVAHHWNFPDPIIRAMHVLPEHEIGIAASDIDRMWHCAGYARELCALARMENAEERERAFAAHLQRFAIAVPVETVRVRALVAGSVEAALQHVVASELKLTQTTLLDGLRELSEPSPAPGGEQDNPAEAPHDALSANPGAAPANRFSRLRTSTL